MTFRKRKIVRISLVILALLMPILAWRLWVAYEVNRQLEWIRAKGLPTNGEELDRWYPAVLASQNAALVLTDAFGLHSNYADNRSNLIQNFKMPSARQPLTDDETE